MKFSVPTNFQDDLIERMNKKEVYEVYGKMTTDFVGGCMSSYTLPPVNKNKLYRHLKLVHTHGLKFNYLLNSVCLGNREWSISGQRKLRRLLDWIVSIGVDSVTVSIPYLLQLIKKEYPQLKVNISVAAGVNSILKAKFWEDLGSDLINLESCGICRNFDLLQKVRKYIKCKLQLIANDGCLYTCLFRAYHFTMNAHASQHDDQSMGSVIDYCGLSCKYLRLLNPVNFIRAIWIRPEDIHYYKKIGVDFIKFVNRSAATEDICRVVAAYTDRRYEGNLVELLLTLNKKSCYGNPVKFLRGMKYFFRPFRFNLFLVYKLSKLLSKLEVYIDNRALDGFLEHFVKGNCKEGMCLDCGYCQKKAEKAVRIDKDYRGKALLKYKDVIDSLLSKRMGGFI